MKGQGMIQPAKLDLTLAKLKKGGENFEIVIDPDLAIAFKKGDSSISITEILKAQKIFADAEKGLQASETKMDAVFGTSDVGEVAKKIIEEGEIHLTITYREKIRAKKLSRIIHLIHVNAMDPKTGLPHPETRIINAINEAKIKIDEFKSAEDQIEEVMKKLRPIIPIKIALLHIQITVPPQSAHQSFGLLKRYGTMRKNAWGSDGSLMVELELPAGLQEELLEKLNNMTHGGADFKIIKK